MAKDSLAITVNGEAAEYEMKDGYAYIRRVWGASDVVKMSFPMEIRRMYGTVRCIDTAGCVGLMRGPIVYCIEGVDNGPQLQALILPRDSRITEHRETEGVLAGTVTLSMDGLREEDSEELYSTAAPERKPVTLKAVPYYIWGNRGTGQMRVWIRE